MIVGSASSAFAMEKALGAHAQFTSGAPVNGTARSRSTSAGSTSPRSYEDARSDNNSTAGFVRLLDSVGLRLCDYPATFDVKATSELPAYDYPVPLLVRNTFIDIDVWRPQRQVQSCPASVVGESPGLEDQFEEGFATSWQSHQAVVQNVKIQAETVMAATLEAPMEQGVSTAVSMLQSSHATSAIEVCGSQAPILDPMLQLPETTAPLGLPVLQPSDPLLGPQLGTQALLTVGSASHQKGVCQPCTFSQTKGCANGVQCTFGHPREPGGACEKKWHRKDKLAMRRAAKIQGLPPMEELMSLYFMNPQKAMRRAAKIGVPYFW